MLYVRNPGAERCPDEAEFRKTVATRLGYDPFFAWARTTVLATIDRRGTGYEGLIELLDEHSAVLGRRELSTQGGDCVEIARAMGLALSVALDDLELSVTSPPTEPAPESLPEPPTASVAARDGAPPTTAAAPRDAGSPGSTPATGLSFAAEVGPIASVGLAPSPSAGAALSIRARRRWLSASLEGRVDLPASGSYASGSVTTNITGGSLLVCVHPAMPLYACALGLVGSFAEHGSAAPVHSDAALFGEAGARLGTEIDLTDRFFLDLHADGAAVLTRHKVQLGGQTVFTVEPLTASAGFGAGLRFY